MHWINYAAEHPEVRQAAALAILVMQDRGVDITQEVIDLVGPLPTNTRTDTAILQLRDLADARLADLPITASFAIKEPKKPGDPIFGLGFRLGGDEAKFWFDLASAGNNPAKYYRRCPFCGKVFEPQRSTGVFCSQVCRTEYGRRQDAPPA